MRELTEKTLALAQNKGADFADLRIVVGEGTAIEVQDGRADKISTATSHGGGLRVLVDGAWGLRPLITSAPANWPNVWRRL